MSEIADGILIDFLSDRRRATVDLRLGLTHVTEGKEQLENRCERLRVSSITMAGRFVPVGGIGA
jgi:hypothetical protein